MAAIGLPFESAALEVGDILIQKTSGEPLLVIERKSHADFAASNTDGRYREQRARLMAVRGGGCAVLYMLEGQWTATENRVWGRVTEGQLKRLTTRLTLRYGLPVLATASIDDTARWCRTLLAQLTDDPMVFQADDAATAAMSGFTAALSINKKGNKTAASTAAAMLSGIPGLGTKRVEALLTTHTIAELAVLEVPDLAVISAGGTRLGIKLAEKMFEAFRG